MTEHDSPALEVARAYYQAWTGKDVEAAMGQLADDVVCDAPAGRIQGVDAYREFLGPFRPDADRHRAAGRLRRRHHGGAGVRHPHPAGGQRPGAECLTVRDGKIVHNRFIFDRLPFEAARRAAGG
jgi:ketosteroid isomerase-like protein